MQLDVERVHECYQIDPAQAYFKCRPQIGPVRTVLCGAFPHEKYHFLLAADYLLNEINNPISKFASSNFCFLFTE
jgi:hypothetical protein